MKRRIRTVFTIIGIGGLLIIIGILMGGNVKKTFYDNGYLDEGWCMDKEELSMDNENTSSALSTHTNETQLISDASVLKQLKADVSYAALRIEPHDKQSIAYSITNNTKRIGASVQIDGDTLVISTKKNHTWSWPFGWKGDRLGRSKTAITV